MAETSESITRLEVALERIAAAQQARLQDVAAQLDTVIAQLREVLEE